MREHCRTQHHYDPDPNPKPSPIRQRKTKELINSSVNSTGLSIESAPVEEFLKMMAYSRFQETGVSDGKREDIAKSLGSIENALDCLLDNFVVVRKKEFQGISGYFCKKCVTFQYRYVRNIWYENTTKDEHVHLQNMPNDANRPVKENERRSEANIILIQLTHSLFGVNKKFDLYRCVGPENFHGPVIKFDYLDPSHWAGIAIKNNGVLLSNLYINDFIINVKGTYAQIIVASGAFKGKYLISVKTIG